MGGLGIDWDNFKQQVRDQHTDLFDFPDVKVFNYTGGYDPATGESSYTRELDATIPAEVTSSTQPKRTYTIGGRESEATVDIYVRDDAPAEFIPFEQDNKRPTEIEVTETAAVEVTYIVVEVFNEGNGLLRLPCVEV